MTATTADALPPAADGLPPATPTSNRVLAVLQRVGRSLMLPIAVMPAAGLLTRLGSPDIMGERDTGTLGASEHGLYLASLTGWHWLIYVQQVFSAAGNGIFNFIPLLFAIGVAVGFARRADGTTALAAAVGYLVFNEVSTTMFAMPINASFARSWYTRGVVDDTIANNPTYAFGGITIGILTALLFQRYYRIKLPAYLAFFGGRRFVPIVTAFAAVFVGVLFGLLWKFPASWIYSAGTWLAKNGTMGAGLFGVINRALLPFGLHHVANNVVWFSPVGASCEQNGTPYNGDLTCFFHGDASAGTYMTGFFPIMMFALPAAAFAMVRCAHPDKRKLVGGIMLSAALCSFLTGVTEPIEFAFLFVAPALFAVHALLTGCSMALCHALGIHDGFSFSAGLFDYIFNFDIATRPLLLIPIGLAFAVVYYFLFTFAIKKFNLPTPGREPDETPAG
ncbi:PTS transporter subunit EIIC [Actinospica durhamensis]|uniref:PTS transporter subunit EIIC n=1 Tax=Actinospica durhamensis TaxID=1508375 RepID=A0A941EYV5_9ACTN|nr:PTS transporter subunit EIIC [Actinospica durhamensis]MBR7836569.1 PTS transporter subunit EIIC [Actinospica durhamensis]